MAALLGENAHNVRTALNLAVEPLQRIGAVDLGPVFPGKGHERQHIVLGRVHQRSQFGHPGAELVGDAAPLLAGGIRVGFGERGDDPG